MAHDGDPLDNLRVLAARVILAMFVFSIIGDFIDDEFLGNRHAIDPAMFAVLTALVGALFAAEVIGKGRSS